MVLRSRKILTSSQDAGYGRRVKPPKKSVSSLRICRDYGDEPERGVEDTIHEMIVYRCRCSQDSVDIYGESRGNQGHCQNHESS
jgi:hypothetical protein